MVNIDNIGNSNRVIRESQAFLFSDGIDITCKSPAYGWLFYGKKEEILKKDGVNEIYIKQSFVYGNEKPIILIERKLPKITDEDLLGAMEYSFANLSEIERQDLEAYLLDNSNTLAEKIKELQDKSANKEKVIIEVGLYNGTN